MSAAKTATLSAAIRNTCDGLDGIVDGVVANQSACNAAFDPAALRCPGGADTGDTCLSDPQLAVVNSWTSDAVFTGTPPYRNAGWSLTGNEDDPGAWAAWVTGNGNVLSALQYLFQDTTVKNYLARDPAVDSLTYTPFDQNLNAIYALGALNSATNADIRPFINSGGKLLLWHGGNDPALSKNATAEYYSNVTATVGTAAADSAVRFYVAPGVNHCSGGPGADSADLLTALDQWVANGTAPGTLTAQKVVSGNTTFERPLCQYPLYPRYTGPANDAAAATLASNYTCS
jgi:feruloyl esterase